MSGDVLEIPRIMAGVDRDMEAGALSTWAMPSMDPTQIQSGTGLAETFNREYAMALFFLRRKASDKGIEPPPLNYRVRAEGSEWDLQFFVDLVEPEVEGPGGTEK